MATLRVFICHAASDSAVAQRLANDLRGAGMDVLADAADLTAPSDFAARISRALADRDALILVLSPAAVASQWAPEAMTAAIARANQGQMRPPVLVQSAPVAPSDIPGLWTTYQRIDMVGDYSRALPQALAALGVTASVAPPVQAPTQPPIPASYVAPVAGATPIYPPSPAPYTPYTPYPAYAPYPAGRPAPKAGAFPVGVAVVFGLLLTVVLTVIIVIVDFAFSRLPGVYHLLFPLLMIHVGDYFGLTLVSFLLTALVTFLCGLLMAGRTRRVAPSLIAGVCIAVVAILVSWLADVALSAILFSGFFRPDLRYFDALLHLIIPAALIGLAAGALGGLAGRGRASAAQSPSPKPPYHATMGGYPPQQ